MSVIKEIALSENTYKQLYDNVKTENEILTGICSRVVADKIISLEKENKTLTEQVNNLEGQLKESSESLSNMKKQYDKSVDDIKSAYETRLSGQLNRQRILSEEDTKQKVRDAKSNEAKRIRNKEVTPLKAERDALIEQIDRTTKETNNIVKELNDKVDTLNQLCINSFSEIISIISNAKTVEEIQEAVEDVIVETKTALGIPYSDNRKPSKADKIAFTNLVNQLSKSGLSNKAIASKLYNEKHPFMISLATENAREQKVGRYLNKKY